MKLALLQFSKEEKDPEQAREPLVECAAALATQFGGTIALEIFATAFIDKLRELDGEDTSDSSSDPGLELMRLQTEPGRIPMLHVSVYLPVSSDVAMCKQNLTAIRAPGSVCPASYDRDGRHLPVASQASTENSATSSPAHSLSWRPIPGHFHLSSGVFLAGHQ